jgi:adenylate cyclase
LRRYLIRLSFSLLLVVALCAHILGRIEIPFIDDFERQLYDARVRLTSPGGKDPRIVIIALDERSMEVEGHWPWTRDKLADMVRNLFAYGAVVVGFDAVFPERDVSVEVEKLKELATTNGDRSFLNRLNEFEPQLNRDYMFGDALASGPSVMAYYFHTDERASFRTGELPLPAFDFDETMAKYIFLPRASGYSSNPPELMAGAYSAGFISNPLIDEDGIVRRTPLLHEFENSAYESLALAMAATYLNDISLPVFVEAPLLLEGYPPLEAVELAGRSIPVDAQGAVLVPYRGPAGSFHYISATDVINMKVENAALLDDSIAIIGATAPGLQDLRSTPFGSIYPGVEIHANVLAGILSDQFRWAPAYTSAAEVISVGVFGMVTAATLPLLSAVFATLLTAVMVTAAIWVNTWLWDVQLHVLPLANTILVLVGLYMINMVFGYFFESRSRSHMNELFGQYVPPDLVSEMAHDPRHYSMESEKRELSVLFTDIRGFTSISENLDAQELSDLLNRFLTPMTQVVHENNGTIDKYMGDAVMAFWGAPVLDLNHAHNAVSAGLQMLAALDELNRDFEKEELPHIKIGVGVNTGTMSVGNMGSRFRRAYTVLGDSVNLGSRLEGLTKAYSVDFIVSEFTRAEAPRFAYREVDVVRVKGKALPVKIYEVVGEEGKVPDDEQARIIQWDQALKLYRAQHWDESVRILLNLSEQDQDKMLYKIYQDRIRHFRAEPPGDDWDGVFTHETK